VAIMLGVVLVMIAATFPFVDQLPQAVISILVGSAAIITGMAAKPFIENFLSGIAITASKMLNIGDTIVMNGNYGTIEDISPTHTVVKLWDWRRFVIPNTQMINQEFVNYSLQDKWLWAHIEFYVSPDSDLRQVKEIAENAARKSPHFHDFEGPSFWVMDAEKDGIKCWLAAWAASPAEAWELKADMRTELILQFQQAGIKSHLNYFQVSSSGVPSGK
jgi:small-conductance mechanosensitive channel